MAKRITCLLLVILLLAGIIPSVLAAELSGDEALPGAEPVETAGDTSPAESSAETGYTESLTVEETAPESSDAETLAENDDSEAVAVLAADDGISLYSSVAVSTDKSRQIRWIGHNNGHYDTSYYDAQGVHHTGYISAISIHRIDNKIAYCIQPTVTFGTSYTEDETDAAWMSQLTANQRMAIALAIAYGYPNMDYPAADPPGAAGDKTLESPLRTDLWQISERVAATQLIVWEIVMGKRAATAPYNCTDTSLFDSFYRKNNPYGYRADWETLKLTYDFISEKMANHKTVPSFSAATSAAAPTHELKYNSSTGSYALTLTDSNGVLSDYDFTSSVSGVTFTRSGNTLTITATPEAAAKLATAQTASATGSSLQIDVNKVVTVWAADGTGQTAVQVKSSPDPVTAYFKLKAAVSGQVLLKKTTNTGTNLSGWKIGLYTDAACTKPVSGSPFTTGTDGKITASNLAAGTYYAREQAVSDPYWACDTSVKTVKVEAGKTATVTFSNTFYGDLRVKKNAVNGSPEGWNFQILDSGKNVIGTITTGADGYAYSGLLLPGTYYIREVHDRDETYWTYDATVEKQITVTAGAQTQVEYTNTQSGKLRIVKTMDTDGPLDGWQFEVCRVEESGDASGPNGTALKLEYVGTYTSAADGTILTENLEPGVYSVREIIPEGSLYKCKTENPQTVAVSAGQTAEVKFTNALKPAEIAVCKTDVLGAPLAGAEFLLEWSDDDGATWQNVTFTDSQSVTKGGCTAAGLMDGRLETGKDGIVRFTGLHPGLRYRLTETKAPEGFQLLTEPAYEGSISAEENLTVELTVVNAPVYELPMTGSIGESVQSVLQIGGALLLLLLLFYAVKKRRK